MADGDGRHLLNLCRQLQTIHAKLDVASLVQQHAPLYDKSQEEIYILISALHKSMRGSDPDAALFWFARMLDGGEDPRSIARRRVRFANEHIATADPQAVHHLGRVRTPRLAGRGARDRSGRRLPRDRAQIYLGLSRCRCSEEAREADWVPHAARA